MSAIIEKTYAFLDTLDKSDLIKNLTESKERLLKNKKILKEIKDIQNEKDDALLIKKRKVIYENEDYKIYMKSYNELSLLVLKINHKYHEYTNTKEHYYE